MKLTYLAISLMVLLSGCATKSEIVPTGSGTYTIFKWDSRRLSSLGRLKSDAYKDVASYCAKDNKDFHVINSHATPRTFGSFPEIEIKFECINE